MPSALASRTAGTNVSVKSERHRETFEAGLKSSSTRPPAGAIRPSVAGQGVSLLGGQRHAYMVMPFYEGVTLKQQLKDMGAAPNEAWLMELLEPLTEALEVIHVEQCFHRDIAPDNVILLKGSGRRCCSTSARRGACIGDMTQALTVILKPGYAPVEQYAEVPGMKQGPWTDVYALAAVVYYAIMGKTPPTSVGRLMADSYVPLSQAAAGRYSPNFLARSTRRWRSSRKSARSRSPSCVPRWASTNTPKPTRSPSRRAKARPARHCPAAPPKRPPAPNRMPLIIGGGVLALGVLGGGLYALLAPTASRYLRRSPAGRPPRRAGGERNRGRRTGASANPGPGLAAPGRAGRPVRRGPAVRAHCCRQDTRLRRRASTVKPQFRIGKDKLGFSVKSARDGHLYVLIAGTDGLLMQLFPNSHAKNNKIRAARR
jgi:serine/threonine protein kinase